MMGLISFYSFGWGDEVGGLGMVFGNGREFTTVM